MVEATDFYDQLESTLPYFLSFVHAPLARKLRQLLVITSKNLLMCLFVELFSGFNIHALFNE